MIPLTQLERVIEDQARESKGQNEVLQAILAKLQLKNKWRRESSAILQRGRSESTGEMGKTAFSLALDGRMSQAIFQWKRFEPGIKV
jgi:hypothetical protein